MTARAKHEFRVNAWGPPAFNASCSCGAWRVVWIGEDLVRRGVRDLAHLDEIARAEHYEHAVGAADVEWRARRDAGFYG